MRISKNISYKEATFTQTRLDNVPNNVQLEAMKTIANRVFEPLREAMGGVPIFISSFFRSEAVNKKIGGSKNSQHTFGEAQDLSGNILGFVRNDEIFNYIKDNLEFDQLIAEDLKDDGSIGWVHVSYTRRYPNRKQVLVMIKDKNKSNYFNYKSLNKKDYIHG